MADLVMKQARAIIDDRTTVICLDIHGVIVPVDQPFPTLAGDFAAPPFHVHCRTLAGPYMKGFVAEARREANAELVKRPKSERRKNAAGYGGDIPGPVTGNQPTGFSRQEDDRKYALEDAVNKAKPAFPSKLADAGKGATGPHDDGWAPTMETAPAVSGPVLDAPELKAADWWFNNQTPVPGMAQTVRAYTNTSGFKMLQQMRGNLPEDPQRTEDIAKMAALIDAQPGLDDNIRVWRGLDAAGMDLKVGGELKDPGFWSTADRQSLAVDFAYKTKEPTLLEIIVPKGTKVANMQALEGLGSRGFDDEEILLQGGTAVRFTGERVETIDGREYRVLTAVVVKES